MAEKEYIEREAAVLSLLDKGQHSRRYKLGEIWELDFEEIREAINSIPAADVRPVVRGKWHSRFYFRESTGTYDCEMRVCSECGSEWSYDAETGSSDFNFCPSCGADMREES